MATSDFALLTVENTGGALALRRKSAAEVVPESAAPLIGTAEGESAVFRDAAGERVLRSVAVNIEPVQAGSGDPSPENIRNITGWESAVIRRTGKNLWGGDAILADVKADIPTATVDDENRTVRYVSTAADYGSFCGRNPVVQSKRGFQFEEGKRYTFVLTLSNSASPAKSNLIVKYTDGTNAYIPSPIEADVKETVVYVSNAGKSVACLAKSRMAGYTTIYADESGIFEGVLTAEDFVPYGGSEVSVEFPEEAGTVCGETLDLTAGELSVNRVLLTFDGSDDWTMISAGKYQVRQSLVGKIPALSNLFLWRGVVTNSSSVTEDGIYKLNAVTNANTLVVMASDYPTLEDFMVLLAATPLQVVCDLDTTAVYQLTPAQIEALAGYNAVTADCGPVEVEYIRDTETAIEAGDAGTRGMIAELSGATASRSLAVGEYVSVGDRLYKVTAAIGAGETLTPGTNVTETTVGEELTALFNLINA